MAIMRVCVCALIAFLHTLSRLAFEISAWPISMFMAVINTYAHESMYMCMCVDVYVLCCEFIRRAHTSWQSINLPQYLSYDYGDMSLCQVIK